MYRVIDIETENIGTDIMTDNKRIISVQIGDDVKQDLYWADSPKTQWDLESAKKEIISLLNQGIIFAGYNIIGFDLRFLKEFMDVEIPDSNLLDLCMRHKPQLSRLTGRNKPRLEEACLACGIAVNHKQSMNELAVKYKTNEAFKKQASIKAKELVKNLGWSPEFSYKYALDKVAGGNAIYDAYLEFVRSGGQKDTLFYEYAIGDVISEYQLLKKLGY
jgi:hypothetical protein